MEPTIRPSAVLLMDLQNDFLAPTGARLPVAAHEAKRVIETANAVLAGQILPAAVSVLIVNQFPRSAHIANFFRHGAAIAGTPGAELDPRVHAPAATPVFSKDSASAFSNPGLDPFLKTKGVEHLYVFGVFAEGCVRATALAAKRLGYIVTVPVDAIGTDADFKRRFARWSLRRAGVTLVPTLFSTLE